MVTRSFTGRAGAVLAGLGAVAAALAVAPTTERAVAALPPGLCDTQGPAGTAYQVGVNCRTVRVDGFPREYIVYVPAHAPDAGSRRSLVFMHHGSTGTAPQFLNISGWREQADATGLVAVFPQGLRYRILENGRLSSKFNDYELASEVDLTERPRGYPAWAPWPADDLSFVDAMVNDIGRGLPIDRHRIYASGFSNGADFTARLAVERSTTLAAAAFSAAGLQVAQPIARPTPMFLTVGSLDDRILGSTGPPPLSELPLNPLALLSEPVVAETVRAHTGTLGLDIGDFGAQTEPHSTSLRWPATGTGPRGAEFTFTVLEGVTHQYPNGRNNPPLNFAVAPIFWDFFQAHPLP